MTTIKYNYDSNIDKIRLYNNSKNSTSFYKKIQFNYSFNIKYEYNNNKYLYGKDFDIYTISM